MKTSPPQTPTQITDRLNAKGAIVATHGANGRPFTRADREALARLPEGTEWFEIHQVSFMVQNPTWRCDRLVTMGVLEKDVFGTPVSPSVGIGHSFRTVYRRMVAGNPAESPQEAPAAPFEALRGAGLAGGKTLALVLSRTARRKPVDPNRAAMDEEIADSARKAELSDSIKASVRQARGILNTAKTEYDELKTSGGVLAETVAVNLCEALDRLNEVAEYFDSIERHEV